MFKSVSATLTTLSSSYLSPPSSSSLLMRLVKQRQAMSLLRRRQQQQQQQESQLKKHLHCVLRSFGSVGTSASSNFTQMVLFPNEHYHQNCKDTTTVLQRHYHSSYKPNKSQTLSCSSLPSSLKMFTKQKQIKQQRVVSSSSLTIASRSSSLYGDSVLHSLKQFQFQTQQQQVRTVFIQTTETPNPESIKFIPTGVTVLVDVDKTGNGYFVTKKDPQSSILRSPLAKMLLDVDGVKSVYLGTDFITVTKFAEAKWKLLNPELFSLIMEWCDSGKPALLDEPLITDTTILDDDTEIVAMIKELIESRIRPAVQEDGGDIRYVHFDEESGIVTVKLAGSCVGCPSSAVTLKQGVENMLMHYIPEVTAVVSEEEEEETETENNDGNEQEQQHVVVDKVTTGGSSSGSDEGKDEEQNKQQKSYEEKLAKAGIPYSD